MTLSLPESGEREGITFCGHRDRLCKTAVFESLIHCKRGTVSTMPSVFSLRVPRARCISCQGSATHVGLLLRLLHCVFRTMYFRDFCDSFCQSRLLLHDIRRAMGSQKYTEVFDKTVEITPGQQMLSSCTGALMTSFIGESAKLRLNLT